AGLEAIFRWMHIFAGITWIGHLYFFNWVNGPFTAKLDGPAKKAVIPELMPRALYWFRWGAAYTWFTGVLLLGLVYYMGDQALAQGAGWGAGPIVMIAVTFLACFIYDAIWNGGLFGTTMAFNVWFRIWPNQQKIIRAVKDGSPLPPTDPIVKVAGLRSRHNTYMSLPLLWAMIGQHTTFFAGGNLGIPSDYYWVFWLIIIIIGWHIVFQCYKKAGKVQGF